VGFCRQYGWIIVRSMLKVKWSPTTGDRKAVLMETRASVLVAFFTVMSRRCASGDYHCTCFPFLSNEVTGHVKGMTRRCASGRCIL
jgi:hypothetical protein